MFHTSIASIAALGTGDAMLPLARNFVVGISLCLLAGAAAAASKQDWDECTQQKDHPLAIRACSQILSESSLSAADRSAALVNRGNAYDDSGEPDRALADYNSAIAAHAGNNDAFFNRGITYRRKGEHARAIADFDQALRLNPRDAEALYYRGRSKIQLGNKAAGEADIAAARRINPDIGN